MLSSNHCIASNTSQEYLYWKPPQENPLMGSLLYSRLQVSKVENSKYTQLKGMHINNASHSKPEKSCSNLLLVMILYFFYRHTQLRQSTRIEPMIHPLFWREKLTVLRFLWVIRTVIFSLHNKGWILFKKPLSTSYNNIFNLIKIRY